MGGTGLIEKIGRLLNQTSNLMVSIETEIRTEGTNFLNTHTYNAGMIFTEEEGIYSSCGPFISDNDNHDNILVEDGGDFTKEGKFVSNPIDGILANPKED